MLEFWKNEWKLFMEDLNSVRGMFTKVFGGKKDYLMLQAANEEQFVEEVKEEPVYQLDAVDHKVTAYFGEDIDVLRQNISGDKTQHEVLRDYAQFFKPYNEAQEMCNSAFRKYYEASYSRRGYHL